MRYPACRACIELGLSSFFRGTGMEEWGPPLLTITMACVPLVPGTGLCYVPNLQMPGVIQDKHTSMVILSNCTTSYIVPQIFVCEQTTGSRPDAEFSTGSVWALRVNRHQKGHTNVQRTIDFEIGKAWWDNSTLGKNKRPWILNFQSNLWQISLCNFRTCRKLISCATFKPCDMQTLHRFGWMMNVATSNNIKWYW